MNVSNTNSFMWFTMGLIHVLYDVFIQWNSKKAEFRVKFEFLKPRLETPLEKLDFSSKPDSKLDSKNPTFRVFLIGFRLNIMFNHVYHVYQWSRSGLPLK
jgi:hypothetical protein